MDSCWKCSGSGTVTDHRAVAQERKRKQQQDKLRAKADAQERQASKGEPKSPAADVAQQSGAPKKATIKVRNFWTVAGLITGLAVPIYFKWLVFPEVIYTALAGAILGRFFAKDLQNLLYAALALITIAAGGLVLIEAIDKGLIF